jgi:hypothetical protein
MDTLVPGNPSSYTGHSLITTIQGAQIVGQDTGVMDINPAGESPFVTTVQIVGGTRQYKRATGEFVATGSLVLATGNAVGTYTATICKGRGEDTDSD